MILSAFDGKIDRSVYFRKCNFGVRRSVPSICKLEIQFNEVNWASNGSLNIYARSMPVASYTGDIEVDTSVEIDFPPDEKELTFQFQLAQGSIHRFEFPILAFS